MLNAPLLRQYLPLPTLTSAHAQDTARDSGILLWVMFLAMDAREPDMCRVAGRLCRALTDGDARSLGVLTRSFPPGLLAPSPPDQVRTSCFVLLTLIFCDLLCVTGAECVFMCKAFHFVCFDLPLYTWPPSSGD